MRGLTQIAVRPVRVKLDSYCFLLDDVVKVKVGETAIVQFKATRHRGNQQALKTKYLSPAFLFNSLIVRKI